MNRYWVGGTGNWSDDDNHWATSSGGTPANGNLPTSLDDVFIDSNSGFGSGGTITVNSNADCKNFDSSSGHTYTIDVTGYREISLYGDLTLESGLTITTLQNSFTPRIETGTMNLTSNGCILPRFDVFQDGGDPVLNIIDNSNFNGDFSIFGGSVVLYGNLTTTGEFYQENGTFDANDHNVTANDFYFYADEGYTPTVIMGSGIWESTNNGSDWDSCWYIDEYNGEVVTIYPETSTIKLSGEGNDPKVFYHYDDTFTDLGKTYNNIWITGEGTGSFTIQGSNTFNEFKVDTPPHTIKFAEETTTTVTTFTTVGADGNLITLDAYKVPSAPSGIELATNGTFTGNADDWALGTSWAYNLNNVIHTPGVEYFGWVSQAVAVEAGKTYRISANVGGNAGYVVLGYGSEASPYYNSNQINAGSGMVYWDFTAYGDLTHILIGGSYLFNGTIDNVSFQELVEDPLTQFTLSKSSGTVECDYLDISNSKATGGAKWYAGENSINNGGNKGWIFRKRKYQLPARKV